MRLRFFCVLLGLAMGWTVASAPAGGASLAPEVKKPSGRPGVVYTPKRRIGFLKKGSLCTSVPGWRAQTLRDLAVAHAEDGIRPLYPDRYGYAAPPEPIPEDIKENTKGQAKTAALYTKYGLDRLCFYTSEGHMEDFPAPAGDPDRMALTAMAPTDLGPLGDQIWEPLADHFLDQVGRVRLGRTQKQSVRLVFVDTHPTGEGPPSRFPAPASWHGYGMAHLGNEIVCGHDTAPQDCPIHIATRLALRYDQYDANLDSPDDLGSASSGGHQGRIGDLAVAILAEIEHWQNTDPGSKLILNLSIGWDGEYIDLDKKKEAELEVSSQAVYNALRLAAHLGVLVIASSGNRSGGENSQWPLLPAAWESHPPTWLPCPFDKKVAYAVGGIDWQGLPLPNTRPYGLPWRVAYGDHAVARTNATRRNGTTEPTKMFTGTSVSAVVASSIAAVVWHLRPDLKPSQVMKRMAHSAETLPSPATFYAWKKLSWLIGPPHLRRLSLCQTVFRLCGPDERRCPGLESIDCRFGEQPAADLAFVTPRHSVDLKVTRMVPPPACDPKTKVFMNGGFLGADTDSCPMETLPDMNAPSLTGTQPPETPCPTCSIAPDPLSRKVSALTLSPGDLPGDEGDGPKSYGIAVAIDPEWLTAAKQNTADITSAVLVVDCGPNSPDSERVDLTKELKDLLQNPTSTSARFSFGTVGLRKSLAGCTASLDYKLTVDHVEKSVQSAVYLDP
ncbi:MAG TPA: S8/S53 family peptidase [Thermoanaerobaculia bacterium]|nr:S8/S53 family peptidase [Thermoanaerobaculia bacterium]